MSDLSSEARAVLAAARRHEAPSAEVRERGWAELRERIARGEAPAEEDQGSDTENHDRLGRVRSRWSTVLYYGQAAVISLSLGLGGALVVVGARAGMGTMLSPRHGEAMQAQRVAHPDGDGGVAQTKSVPRRPAGVSRPVEDPALAAPDQPESPAEEPPAPVPRVQRPQRAKASPTMTSIEADVALLRAAKATHDPQQALSLLQEHKQRYPGSSFAIERQVLEIEALCELDQRAQGRALAATFLRQHPGSAFTARVRKACR